MMTNPCPGYVEPLLREPAPRPRYDDTAWQVCCPQCCKSVKCGQGRYGELKGFNLMLLRHRVMRALTATEARIVDTPKEESYRCLTCDAVLNLHAIPLQPPGIPQAPIDS